MPGEIGLALSVSPMPESSPMGLRILQLTGLADAGSDAFGSRSQYFQRHPFDGFQIGAFDLKTHGRTHAAL